MAVENTPLLSINDGGKSYSCYKYICIKPFYMGAFMVAGYASFHAAPIVFATQCDGGFGEPSPGLVLGFGLSSMAVAAFVIAYCIFEKCRPREDKYHTQITTEVFEEMKCHYDSSIIISSMAFISLTICTIWGAIKCTPLPSHRP